ncbi:MAG: chaperone NapD [Eggerthellaceae bacterium]|nr:chaperone NapD [Eggerthellaceae bacterium]
MVISSLVVETAPEYTGAVAAKLPGLDGVEVHGVEGYKIVITIERDTVDESHAVANSIVPIEGVLGVNLIYLNFEDDKTIYPDGV